MTTRFPRYSAYSTTGSGTRPGSTGPYRGTGRTARGPRYEAGSTTVSGMGPDSTGPYRRTGRITWCLRY